jgi:type VI secretion system protein ImpL
MKRVLQLLLSPVVLGTLGLLALSALVWWVGPLVAVGSVRPLDPVWLRVLILVLLWAAWIGRLAYRAWRRKRTNAALLQGLGAGPTAASKEAQALAARFDEAVAKLKAARGRSFFGGGTYLYELPWYVFVGAPGSGKTTALMNAGLQFLLGDAKGGKASVQGVGGTRNCEWWFTQDAVLIDTAGRYATQDSDKDVDASAWDNFLALLKKTRPRQPINGVLLTVNVQDLLQQGAPERAEHATQLRARLAELQTKLGVRAPVYVLVTKADLLGGFNETFEALDKDGRDQVWGFTFTLDETEGGDALAGFGAQFQLLQQRLVQQLVGRLEAERDVLKRSAIFAFPQEFAALQPVLADFLRQVFSGGGALEAQPRVRGVYFTSGTQEGSSIDRVMGAIGRSFGIEGRASAIAPGRGKSFFLHRLLKDVVFAERGLGATNAAAERRRRVLRLSAAGAMALASVAVVVGWAVSRARNVDHAQQVAERVPALKAAVAALPAPTSADVSPLPQPLAQVRDAAVIDGVALDDPPLLHGLGLYQGDKLDAAAQLAYQRLLEKQMQPRVARRLEERLRAVGRDNLEAAYEALKAYLMLHSPERFDAEALRAWIAVDWDAQYARMAPEDRAQLDRHLDAMLALGPPRAAVARDDALVAGVREMLAAYPLEYRVYSRIKRQYRPGTLPEFTAAGAAGPNAAQAFERKSGEPLTRGISGFFTKDGYRRVVLPSVQKATAQLANEEGWVLGLKTDPARLRDATLGTAVSDKVRRLYFTDYIKTWDAYIDDVRLVKLSDPERAMAVSRLLAGVDSPLAAWLRGVSEQTKLVAPAAPPNPAQAAADKARADAAALAGAAPPATAGAAGGPLERMVDDHFAPIHRLVAGEPPPINETLKLFGELHAQLAAADQAKKTKSPPPPGGGGAKVKVAAAQQPELVRGMVEQLAAVADGVTQSAEVGGIAAELRPIAEICARTISGRYPFASGSNADVLPDDLGQMFGAGGLLDEFFQRRLAGVVDVSTPVWSYKPLPDGTRPPTPSWLPEFQRAARIRDAFFRAGGKQPQFRFDVGVTALDPALKEVVIELDGQVNRLSTTSQPMSVTWPSQRVASSARLSVGSVNAQVPQSSWAMFRLFDQFRIEPGASSDRFSVVINPDNRPARLEVRVASALNPFALRELRQFRCPAP